MSEWDELNDEYQDEWEDDLEDPDDCMDCGVCDDCVERTKAFFEDMEAEVNCGCEEDMTKPYGGHKPDCPNRIPF